MDAIILAGGKSERLSGIVPPYHKPFLVIGGESLLVRAVRQARENGANRIVVVCTGENALPVWQLVGHLDRVRVVLNAGGVAQSVIAGLELCQNKRVLILMSDNIHKNEEISEMCRRPYAIGVQVVPSHGSERFTRLINDEWIEDPLYVVDSDYVSIWCGPLIVDLHHAREILFTAGKIGPYLAQLTPVHTPATHIHVTTVDVGVPSVVQELTTREC